MFTLITYSAITATTYKHANYLIHRTVGLLEQWFFASHIILEMISRIFFLYGTYQKQEEPGEEMMICFYGLDFFWGTCRDSQLLVGT